MEQQQNRRCETVEDWMQRLDFIGPFAPLTDLQRIYDEAPDGILSTPEYWYISGFLQGRKGYQPLPDAAITPEQHLEVLDLIADSSAEYGMEMAQQAAGLRDGYSIALGYYGDP